MNFLKENNLARAKYLPLRGKAIKLPVYFPSISSIKTNLSPFAYFKILKVIQPHFLVSAYDIFHAPNKTEFLKMLQTIIKEDGPTILMDSGNYESYWAKNKSWDIKSFNDILKKDVCDMAFCYDNQKPSVEISKNVSWIKSSTMESQSVTKKSTIAPIVHCAKEKLNKTVTELNKQIYLTTVSIPERNLGDGILQRVETLTKLRRELMGLDHYINIHILGTGNPLSLLLLSLAGADMFDGLEWCQTVVNSRKAILYHFQQRDLITDECAFCNDKTIKDYTLKTLGHNLAFYLRWMEKIQGVIESNGESALLKEYFDSNTISKLSEIWA
jgi:queuine/archaeosine tRNA-ribosyltransferase